MAKIKLKLIDFYRILGIVVILATMALCQFNSPKTGEAIQIPKEMWAVIMMAITHTFMSVSNLKLQDSLALTHTRGLVTIILLIIVGGSILFSIEIGKEWWSALGTVTAFLYGGKEST